MKQPMFGAFPMAGKFTFTAIAIAVLAAVVAGCGGGSTSVTMHGAVTAMGGGAIGEDACSWGAMPAGVAYGKVDVVSPSGTELAQVSLGHPVATGKHIYGVPVCAMPFTAAGLPAESMYGIKTSGVSGTTWVHQDHTSHVSLFVGPQL